ncbi:hypothetical protein BH11PSE11_BH11PSE11_34240 [soil metagenome]
MGCVRRTSIVLGRELMAKWNRLVAAGPRFGIAPAGIGFK